MRRLWHYQSRPKMFRLNSWEKRNWGGNEKPETPAVKTADQLFNESIAFAKQNTPLAYGARESALKDIGRGNEYYSGFQPTSFEQALGNQYFQNVMPDIERSIKQNLSLSGIESSPILAQLIAKQRGQTGVDIGQILSNLANQRAGYSLQSRLGIDPYLTYGNYLGTNQAQSEVQRNVNYQNALQRYGEEGAKRSGITSLIGGGLGALAGLPFGMPLQGFGVGSSLGGAASTMFGGTGGPISFQNAFDLISPKLPTSTMTSPTDLFNYQNIYDKIRNIGKAVPVNTGSSTFEIGNILEKLRGGMPQFSLGF